MQGLGAESGVAVGGEASLEDSNYESFGNVAYSLTSGLSTQKKVTGAMPGVKGWTESEEISSATLYSVLLGYGRS